MILVITIVCIISTIISSSEVTTSKSLPQAIIIGVKKCGTRALLKFLSIHPATAVSSTEIHYFDSPQNFQFGLDWYRNQMPIAKNNQYLTIEKTPHYFIDRQTPARIAHLLPEVKLIVILRDPIIRAISDYVQIKNRHESYPTFDEFISMNNFTRWTPIKIGCYSLYLRRWLKYFPLERIHFVDGENLIQRPWQELESVQKFLNISNHIQQEHFYFNSHKRNFPCIKQPNGCLGSSKGRHHPSISEHTREKLKTLYSTCNQQLKELAQINFSWL
ncbi:unnamed protein product [Rotaria socialis]|uniref:Sulfotransferase domain-containing protein n=2 Tax=Rotaria socialis TaxID=392032 RepID=A0A818K861_9BILA|nr:unnamed protein product [Rotaria socialis]CAF3410670.1 unnamed protein product [Rotaria socialis]CAF3419895.1 unnamed protein product [Rotaria socialis]CAF3439335.1 unnamed protein product [Rotaria socialis]CAF3555428.1 unnamed protein product [Rotaria socialis]